jgi:PmbA protein
MHRLIERAREAVDQAELYWNRTHAISAQYENGRLQQITEDDLSSLALRVIDDGKMGSTFAMSPDQPGLIEQAKAAAAHGDPATFSFAPTGEYAAVEAFDPETARLTSDDLVALSESVLAAIRRERDDLPLIVTAETQRREVVVETTEGAEGRFEGSDATLSFGAPIKGAGMGVYKWVGSVSPLARPDAMIGEFVEWYGWTERISTPVTGRLPVIFAPEAAFLYLLPLWAGLEGNAIEKRTSPLVGRLGDRILSERLTVVDDPLASGELGSRPFDDEGVPCCRRAIIENGILTGYLLDLRTGRALGAASTGNAVKRELFSGGTETRPSPWPIRLSVEPGEIPYREMIAGLDEGLLVYFGMGFHSGNYPQGKFSVQAIGYHIVDGAVGGRLDKTMISGDIYADFQRVRAVSAERGPALTFLNATVPFVLVDSLQVAGA